MENPQPASATIPPIYLAETVFKAAFIVMAVFNLNYKNYKVQNKIHTEKTREMTKK